MAQGITGFGPKPQSVGPDSFGIRPEAGEPIRGGIDRKGAYFCRVLLAISPRQTFEG